MARKIGVMKVGQNTGQPRTYVKKSVAVLLIRRNLAEWAEGLPNLVIRMRRELSPIKVSALIIAKPFIPERMPSPEVKGCYFEDPRFPHRPIELMQSAS